MNELKDEIQKKSVIGLVPAAGMATRGCKRSIAASLLPKGRLSFSYQMPLGLLNYLKELANNIP